MKKLLSVFLSLCLCLSLVACGGEKTPAEPFSDTVVTTLLESDAFSEELEGILILELVCELFGVEQDTVTAFGYFGSTGATAEELAFFKFTSEDAAQAAKAGFETRVADRAEAMADYLPNEVPKLEKAIIEVRGNTLLYVVANDYAPVEQALS